MHEGNAEGRRMAAPLPAAWRGRLPPLPESPPLPPSARRPAQVRERCREEVGETLTPSFSLSIRTLFKATVSPLSLFVARYTCPYCRNDKERGVRRASGPSHGGEARAGRGFSLAYRPLANLLQVLEELDAPRTP